MRVRHWFALFVAAGVAAACGRNANGAPPRARAGADAVPVAVSTVVERAMPVELRVVGTVEPAATVSVRALVGGELTGVQFREGEDVTRGDLLFTIDPRPFEAQLHQVEATLARDTAQADNAQSQLGRYRDLVARGIATKEQMDQITTSATALQATVKADAAAVENARLNLQYATIRAPMTGRTGSLMIQPGNLVRTTDTTPLVVINQISPIYVTFSVPEAALGEIRRYQAAGSLQVTAEIPGGQPVERGRISFVDNTVDRATGTIRLKGTFENAGRRLWPGLFVNVVLTLQVEPHAIVTASRAIQDAQDGKYVYVVKADRTVESRPVTVARTIGDAAVVASGLRAGEQVVTDGQLRLVAGKRVILEKPHAEARGEQ